MDLEALVDDEFVQPLRGAIVADNLVATRQLIESVHTTSNITANKQEVKVFASAYILELRDGTQPREVSLQDLEVWIEAKGLTGILDPHAVQQSIAEQGTTWNRAGGSKQLRSILNSENIQRIMDIAIEETIHEIHSASWQSR